MKKRSNLTVMMRLIGLVKPLTGYMIFSSIAWRGRFFMCYFHYHFRRLGFVGCPAYGISCSNGCAFAIAISIAVARDFLRYGEQACNHYIAFKLLALIRDHVFKALRKTLPC